MPNEYFQMEVEGDLGDEEQQFNEGITYPGLVWLTSHHARNCVADRGIVLDTLSGLCDERGMMSFFVNPELREKYPPDLESTALFVAACHINDRPVVTDLATVQSMITPGQPFPTWVGKSDTPFDATSQLIMALCYGLVGLDTGATLKEVLKIKFTDYETLKQRDAYYTDPLLLIYYTLFIPDKGILPNNYLDLVSRFLEGYEPANTTEMLMIQKICRVLSFNFSDTTIDSRKKPLFTNGHRKIAYFSRKVRELLEFSALRDGTNLT